MRFLHALEEGSFFERRSLHTRYFRLGSGQLQGGFDTEPSSKITATTQFFVIPTGVKRMKHSPGFLKLVDDAKSRIRECRPEDVKSKKDRGERFNLVDVREDNEWEKGRAAGAIHLGKGIIERDIESIIADHDAEIILYCGGGYRSALVADALQRMGYKNAISMDGGWKRWTELDYPIEH